MLSSSASLISAKRLARSEARCPHSEEDAQWASHELVALRAEVERLRPLEHEVERLRAENEAHKDKAERLQAEVENLRALAAGFRPTRASSNEGSDSAAETEVEQENADSVCTFTFVSAAYLRGLPDNAPPLPSFQELKKVPGALVRRTLDRDVAYRGGYAKKQLAVSQCVVGRPRSVDPRAALFPFPLVACTYSAVAGFPPPQPLGAPERAGHARRAAAQDYRAPAQARGD